MLQPLWLCVAVAGCTLVLLEERRGLRGGGVMTACTGVCMAVAWKGRGCLAEAHASFLMHLATCMQAFPRGVWLFAAPAQGVSRWRRASHTPITIPQLVAER